MPPAFCASAITCRVIVVLPEDSGPNTSTTRPRGNPPTPSAASTEIDPLEITVTERALREPSCHTEPLPYCFSIWTIVCMIRRLRSDGCMITPREYWCTGQPEILR